MKASFWNSLLAATLTLGLSTPSQVQAADLFSIISPVSATASSQFSAEFSITNTINRSGLSVGFTSGTTLFDSYIASNPSHTLIAAGNEWFTPLDVTTAVVTYNLGSITTIDRFALWNEESSGIGSFDFQVSTNGVNFTTLLSGISPIDNPFNVNYLAQVFSLSPVEAQFVRLNISGCPQLPTVFNGCGIGEVAFRVAPGNEIPEPAPLGLLGGVGLLAFFGIARKLKQA